jgi:hypothetical protein
MRRTTALLALALSMAVACSRPPASERAPGPTLAGDSSAGASASLPDASRATSAPAVSAAADAAPVDRGAKVDARLVRFAAAVCAAATFTEPDGTVVVGCPSHPPYDPASASASADAGLSVYTDDPLLFCSLDAVYEGSFTRAGARQAVLAFGACKESPEAMWDAGFPGSAQLVEQTASGWTQVTYEPDVNARFCITRRRADGRDVLVCRSGLGAGSAGSLTYLFLLDFARRGRRAGTFAQMFGQELVCPALMDATSGAPLLPDGLVRVSPVSLQAAPGADGFVVDVDRARVPPSPDLDARAAKACRASLSTTTDAFLPPAVHTRLQYSLRGDGVAPTDATRRTLAAWRAEIGDHGGIGSAAPPPLGP